MAKLRSPQRRRTRRTLVARICVFCQKTLTPDYKNEMALKSFLSGRGRILTRDKTGTCAKHQRQLARTIKRARHLSLLPFVVKLKEVGRIQS